MSSLESVSLFSDTSRPPQELKHAAHFSVIAEIDSDVLGRLLGYFSQLSLVPLRFDACCQDDLLRVSIRQPGLSPHRAGIVAEKMRSLVCVQQVELSVSADIGG